MVKAMVIASNSRLFPSKTPYQAKQEVAGFKSSLVQILHMRITAMT